MCIHRKIVLCKSKLLILHTAGMTIFLLFVTHIQAEVQVSYESYNYFQNCAEI